MDINLTIKSDPVDNDIEIEKPSSDIDSDIKIEPKTTKVDEAETKLHDLESKVKSQGEWVDTPAGKMWKSYAVKNPNERKDANMFSLDTDTANIASHLPESLQFYGGFAGDIGKQLIEAMSAPESVLGGRFLGQNKIGIESAESALPKLVSEEPKPTAVSESIPTNLKPKYRLNLDGTYTKLPGVGEDIDLPLNPNSTGLDKIDSTSGLPKLAGFQNMRDGTAYIQFHRDGKIPTPEELKAMFPQYPNIQITKFKNRALRPDLEQYRIDAWDNTDKINPSILDEMEKAFGGNIRTEFRGDMLHPLPEDQSHLQSNILGGNIFGKIRDRIFGKTEAAPKLNPIPDVASPSPNGNALQSILDRLKAARPLTAEQRNLYKIEHSARGNEIDNLTSSGRDWASQVKGKLKGEYSKVPNFAPIEMSGEETDQLLDTIKNSSNLMPLEKAGTIFSLEKILRGQIPSKSELSRLELAFDVPGGSSGGSMGQEMVNTLLALRPRTTRTTDEFNSAAKTMMSSMDMSAPLRQGLPLIHRKEWWTSLDDMFKSWGSDKAAQAINETIIKDPAFKTARTSGLSLTDTRSLTRGEEGFGSRLVQGFPLVKRSERAYSAFLNKLRFDTFKSMYKDATEAGADPADAAHRISEFINTATGRGKLGKIGGIDLEQHVDALNQMFFAPRFMASRLKMMTDIVNPRFYADTPAYIRKEALKSAFATLGFMGTMSGLGKLAGAEVSSDMKSTDFGKVKFGDTRMDPGAGFLQNMVLAARLVTGSTRQNNGRLRQLNTGKFGAPTKKDMVERYLASKLSPSMSMAYDRLKGTNGKGEEIKLPEEIASRFTPMFIQDVYEIMQSDKDYMPEMPRDSRQLLAIPPDFFGMGSQTY